MMIYNTTYLVADKHYHLWLKWLKEVHVPYMVGCGFSDPQIAKVLSTDKSQEGSSISVQFKIGGMNELISWNQSHADKLNRELAAQFGTEVLSFSTILEILD